MIVRAAPAPRCDLEHTPDRWGARDAHSAPIDPSAARSRAGRDRYSSV